MTKEEIIRMAREAGFATEELGDGSRHVCVFNFQDSETDVTKELERFAALVAAASASVEREACAKLVEPDEEHRRDAAWGYLGGKEGVELLDSCAAAIRARRDEVTYGETLSRGQA